MERRHAARLRERFGPALFEGKVLACLDIPDDYGFMDPELIDLLEASVGEFLELPRRQEAKGKRKKSARAG